MEKQRQSSLRCPPPGRRGVGRLGVWRPCRRHGWRATADRKLGHLAPSDQETEGCHHIQGARPAGGPGPLPERWARPAEQQEPALGLTTLRSQGCWAPSHLHLQLPTPQGQQGTGSHLGWHRGQAWGPEHPSPVSPARAPPHPIWLTQPQAYSSTFPRGRPASKVVPGQGASAQKAASETRVLLGQPSASLLPCGAEAWEDWPLWGRQPPLLPKPCRLRMEAESEHQRGQGCGRGPRPPRKAPRRAPGPRPTPSQSPAASTRPPSPSCSRNPGSGVSHPDPMGSPVQPASAICHGSGSQHSPMGPRPPLLPPGQLAPGRPCGASEPPRSRASRASLVT